MAGETRTVRYQLKIIYFFTCLSFMSGKGSRILCSKTYFATGLCSELTLKGTSKVFVRLKPRLITNPTAADDSAIPTAPNNNLFSFHLKPISFWKHSSSSPLSGGGTGQEVTSRYFPGGERYVTPARAAAKETSYFRVAVIYT